MKVIFALVLSMVALIACKKEKMAPEVVLMETPMDTAATWQQVGQFINGPYGNVTGQAVLIRNSNGTYEILLENFNTTNGPDLYVYLSKEIMPANFILLEKLRSTNGNQVYSIPGTPDFTQFKYVCIHCRRYNHLFGYAQLR